MNARYEPNLGTWVKKALKCVISPWQSPDKTRILWCHYKMSTKFDQVFNK